MLRTAILATAVFVGSAATTEAYYPRLPYPPPAPVPQSGIEGRWFMRGDPFKPCYIQAIATPKGPALLVTNENGTSAYGWLNRSGQRLTIPDWNLVGTVRGNAIVWPNGDFWSR